MAPFLLLAFLLLLSSASVHAQQNITLGSSLTPQGPNRFWLSPSGDFAFGFQPIDGNTSSYLLAIWFNRISSKTVAWYAKTIDQDAALVQVSSGSHLQLTTRGILSLQDSTGTEVWKPQVVDAAYAIMLDTGNFVLAAADGSTKWESFKNPIDTILLTQVLTPGMMLRSQIIPKYYSNGRFLLSLKNDGVFFYYIAVPSGHQYDYYWSIPQNRTNMVFNATGIISSGFKTLMLSNQNLYPKMVSNLNAQQLLVRDFKPQSTSAAEIKVGSGTCSFNSYWTLDATCMCPPQYSYIDQESKDKGCKPDFQLQSCDMDEAAANMQFQLIPMTHVDWPGDDYEQYTPISKNKCQQLCLTDCFCAVAVFRDEDNTCWKKKMPLLNGIQGDGVQRTVFIKVPKNNSTQSEPTDFEKWNKDKKYWILRSSLFLGSSVLVNILLISIVLLGSYCTITRKEVPSQQSSNNIGSRGRRG